MLKGDPTRPLLQANIDQIILSVWNNPEITTFEVLLFKQQLAPWTSPVPSTYVIDK